MEARKPIKRLSQSCRQDLSVVCTNVAISNRGGEKWRDFRNILRIQPTVFSYGTQIACEGRTRLFQGFEHHVLEKWRCQCLICTLLEKDKVGQWVNSGLVLRHTEFQTCIRYPDTDVEKEFEDRSLKFRG